MSMPANQALDMYKQVGTHVGVATADPHRLITLLYEGALERIAVAKGALQRGEIAFKGQKIGEAINILDGLLASLDQEKGGELAQNLEELYLYMQRRLLEANLNNDIVILDEISGLVESIKNAWVSISDQPRHSEDSL